jgi:hypothetical protein
MLAAAVSLASACGGRAATDDAPTPAPEPILPPDPYGIPGGPGTNCASLPRAGSQCTPHATCRPKVTCKDGRKLHEEAYCVDGSWQRKSTVMGACDWRECTSIPLYGSSCKSGDGCTPTVTCENHHLIQREAACEEGAWQVTTTMGSECDWRDCASLPQAGSPCASGEACNPKVTCEDDHEIHRQAICVDGAWQPTTTSGGDCVSPCPRSKPAVGSACGIHKLCSYEDECPSHPAHYREGFECTKGKWQRSGGDYTVPCPREPPVEGESCAACAAHYFDSCDYGSCRGQPSTTASCDARTGRWNVTTTPCDPIPHPPPVDAGLDAVDAGAPDGAQ